MGSDYDERDDKRYWEQDDDDGGEHFPVAGNSSDNQAAADSQQVPYEQLFNVWEEINWKFVHVQ